MLQENERKRRPRCKPGIAHCFSNYAVPKSNDGLEVDDDIWWTMPSYYYQIGNTMGMERLYQHKELECFITFSVEDEGCSILRQVEAKIRNGARFSDGERLVIKKDGSFLFDDEYTVEFRNSENCYGPCLRIVVLGIEEEFQSLPEKEAWEWLSAHGPLIDPYASYYD